MTAWTWHGGGVEAARRQFGDGDWIDLSTGINPDPWPGVAALAIDWQRLPEPHALAELEAAAAAHFGVDSAYVCAVPGTEIALRLAGTLVGGPAGHRTPSYRTHVEMIPGSVPIAHETLDRHRGTLILANPNNPDGQMLSPNQLRDLLDRRGDGWLLLDEAFADPIPPSRSGGGGAEGDGGGLSASGSPVASPPPPRPAGAVPLPRSCAPRAEFESLAAEVSETRRLILFRSFGKFFGLAGVRLGFVLGPATILAPLRATLGAWPISAAAIAIGTAAYRDRDWIAATRIHLREQAAALDTVLVRAGYQPTGACPLFRLIETPEASALFERLARQAILTRPFAEQPDWLRIGLPPIGDALARLKAALTHG